MPRQRVTRVRTTAFQPEPLNARMERYIAERAPHLSKSDVLNNALDEYLAARETGQARETAAAMTGEAKP